MSHLLMKQPNWVWAVSSPGSRFPTRWGLYFGPRIFPQKRKRQLIVTKMSPKWWAPTSSKWSYTPSHPVVRPFLGVSTLLISSRGPPFYESYKQKPFQNPHAAEQKTDDFPRPLPPVRATCCGRHCLHYTT